jgi:hypothetical protein
LPQHPVSATSSYRRASAICSRREHTLVLQKRRVSSSFPVAVAQRQGGCGSRGRWDCCGSVVTARGRRCLGSKSRARAGAQPCQSTAAPADFADRGGTSTLPWMGGRRSEGAWRSELRRLGLQLRQRAVPVVDEADPALRDAGVAPTAPPLLCRHGPEAAAA